MNIEAGLSILKFISLMFSIWFTSVNFIVAVHGQTVPAFNFFVMSLAITLFVFLQFNLF